MSIRIQAIFAPETRRLPLPFTTAPREPAWHHRRRKERSVARHIQWLGKELIRTRPVLDRHHGSSSCTFNPMGTDGIGKNASKGHWLCHGCQYYVPRGELYCNGCGHQPPAHVSQLIEGWSKGGGKGASAKGKGKGKGPGKAAGNAATTSAARDKAKLEAKDKELKDLQAKLKSIEEKSTAVTKDEMDVDKPGSDASKEAARLQKEIGALKAVPEEVKAILGDSYLAKIQALDLLLQDARKTVRTSGSTEKQLEEARGFQQRASKRVDKAKEELATQEAQLQALAETIAAQKVEVTGLETKNQEAIQQVTSLVAKYAKEATPGQTGVAPSSASMDPPTGFVSLAVAQEAWDKREAEYAAQWKALQAEADQCSEASDDQDKDLEEDADWGKLEPAKKKSIISKAKSANRRALSTKIGNFGCKKGILESPFKK